jgi:uncharacterized protein
VRLFLSVFLIASLVCIGCKKTEKRPSAAEIHAITRQFVAATDSATPPGTGTDVHSDLRASDVDRESTDRLDVTVRADPKQASNAAVVARLLQALGKVATQHRLTQDSPSERPEEILFQYRRQGFATHTIHLHTPGAAASRESTRAASPYTGRLAVILDDFGNDPAAAEAVFALRYPITLSVLPDRPHSVEIAEEARRLGYEVMLHLPMESVGDKMAESRELRPGMSPAQVTALVNGFLREIPEAAGVNNHQGSQSTADAALMDALMPVLREHQLFYVDSRTTTATIAFDTAQRMGVRSAFRNVPFLDDVAQVGPVRKQLQVALRDAREKAEAIAIGHPHLATLKALTELSRDAEAQGVKLVFASELVR